MNNSIYPCLTITGKITEAADYYINVFGEGTSLHANPFVIQIQLSGQKFMLLNEGPTSTPNPSVSFMVMSENAATTEQYWNKLIDGGKAMMPLDKYPWSDKYGWVEDKYGVSWQLNTANAADAPQKFCPTLMFTKSNVGKATEAIHFYTSLFPSSGIRGIMNYAPGEGDKPEYVKHAQFTINDFVVMAMDSSGMHEFSFNDAISLVVECDTQAEIDKYWDTLTGNGGREVACGWLTDKYGISWQIVPKKLAELMSTPERGQKVMGALMKMKKLVIADLENA
jgi:predicted 3-demethylubiquinone-9 3-methyltransferase (glyoxalase superfamily)